VTIENKESIKKKTDKQPNSPLIHYFFVSNLGGVCLYARNYSNIIEIDEQLISAFCCALISFSNEIVGKRIKKIDMDPQLQIFIIQRYNLFYGFLTDNIDSMILEDYIDSIDNRIRKYINTHKIDINIDGIKSESINTYIDEILNENKNKKKSKCEKNTEASIKEILKKFLFRNDVEGLILFDNKGRIVYCSLTYEKLNYILKNVDFRVKIINKAILKLFYTTKRELIFSKFIDENYFVVLIFDISTPFGIAEYLFDRIIKKVRNINEK
jgi:hypothetical protein